MRRYFFIFKLVFFIIFALSGIYASAQKESPLILDVRLTVEASFSYAQVMLEDWNETAKAHYYARNDETKEEVKREKEVSAEDMAGLRRLIMDNDFWAFKPEYIDDNISDATTYGISVKWLPASCRDPLQRAVCDAAFTTVKCYAQCPAEINEIRAYIQKLWGEEILEIGI